MGARFALAVHQQGSTMSILIAGDEPVIHRRCEAQYLYGLQDWFAWAEMNAWERVNAYYGSTRPKEIFLIVGQYLTTSYATAHKVFGALECEVVIESNVQLPTVVEGEVLGRLGIRKAYAQEGFEYVMKKCGEQDPTNYSIILDTYKVKSGPLQRFTRSLKTRVEEQYQ